MEEKEVQWIAERAKCDIKRLYDDIATLVKNNTNQWGTVSKKDHEMRGGLCFEHEADGCFRVRHDGIQKPETLRFCFETEKMHIIVMRDCEKTCTITTRWNRETSQCLLVVENHPEPAVEFPHAELWKVVQYVLEPFFFPPAD